MLEAHSASCNIWILGPPTSGSWENTGKSDSADTRSWRILSGGHGPQVLLLWGFNEDQTFWNSWKPLPCCNPALCLFSRPTSHCCSGSCCTVPALPSKRPPSTWHSTSTSCSTPTPRLPLTPPSCSSRSMAMARGTVQTGENQLLSLCSVVEVVTFVLSLLLTKL